MASKEYTLEEIAQVSILQVFYYACTLIRQLIAIKAQQGRRRGQYESLKLEFIFKRTVLFSGSSLMPRYTTSPNSPISIPAALMYCTLRPSVSTCLFMKISLIRNIPITYTPAGKDATQIFFGLHRHEVLLRPQYKRLQIGTVVGQKELIKPPTPGELSRVPYGEPTWLTKGYFSPYYTDNHRKFQTAVRHFFQTVVAPESVKCEESGKKISQDVVDKMAYVPS